MTKANGLSTEFEMSGSGVPWEERLEDHNNKIDEYLQNCIFRGCNVDGTVYQREVLLQSIFRRVPIVDTTHPTGDGHLLIWGLLSPSFGSHYLSLIVASLLKDDLALATRRRYMNDLLDFCTYVLAKPHVPGVTALTIVDKYGPITAPFSKYDLPIHSTDRPRRKRYALGPNLRDNFFEFLRVDYLPNHSLPHMGARDFVAIILQTELGARSSELLGIRSEGGSCDIDRSKNRVRLFGKGSAYSGKRIRWVPLTPLAAEVLGTFQKVFKPMFPKSPQSDYLFLNEDGSRLTKFWYWKTFRKIVDLAIEAGVPLPDDLRPHDLRRTCATNKLEKEPLAYRKVLKHLGHTYPSSAAPYLIATDEDVEEQQSDLIDIFVDPYIDKKEEED
jgi:integrase